jgi:hypothetical protein
LQDVLRFASQLFAHNLSKVDPILMSRIQRNLTTPIRYLTAMFEQRACQDPDTFDAAKVARHFVFEMTAHDDVIDREEATGLGLPIVDLRTYPYFENVQEAYGKWLDQDKDRPPMLEFMEMVD